MFKIGDKVRLRCSRELFEEEVMAGVYFYEHGALDDNNEGVVQEVYASGAVTLKDNIGCGGCLISNETRLIEVIGE